MATSIASATAPTAEAFCPALPEYRLLDCIGRTPLAEVWKAAGPDGNLWAVKYIYAAADRGSSSSQVLNAAQRLQAMRHPHLAVVQAVANDAGRLVFVTELADMTLRDRFEECWTSGQSGIPRLHLLHYLTQAAAALDHLRAEHAMQHLSLHPNNLLLRDDQLLVADFGLVQLLWLPLGQPISAINPRYAAPEVFDGRLSANSDQYSLALIYQEMLTGQLPQRGHASRQLAEARQNGQIDLDLLPAHDRPVMMRAYQVDPRERFPCCMDFIQALLAAARATPKESLPPRPPAASSKSGSGGQSPISASAVPLAPAELIDKLVASAARPLVVKEFGRVRYTFAPDGTWQHKCAAFLPPGVAQHKLRAFLRRWNAEVVAFSEDRLVFHLDLAAKLWHKLLGRKENILEVSIGLGPARPAPARLTEVIVALRFLRGDSPVQRQLLEQVGPVIVDELHAHLIATKERRLQERFAFSRPLYVTPAQASAHPRTAKVECLGKDISTSGIGFYTPLEPPATQVFICHSPGEDQGTFAIPAAVTRVQRTSDGWYEAGARFLVEPPRATHGSPKS